MYVSSRFNLFTYFHLKKSTLFFNVSMRSLSLEYITLCNSISMIPFSFTHKQTTGVLCVFLFLVYFSSNKNFSSHMSSYCQLKRCLPTVFCGCVICAFVIIFFFATINVLFLTIIKIYQ